MKKLMKSLAFLSLFISIAHAQNCSSPITLGEFEEIMRETQRRYFPELDQLNIGVRTFKSDAYFLQTQPVAKTLVRPRDKRKYVIELNLRLLDCPPGQEALEAILAHEFEHIMDFSKWNSMEVIHCGLHFVTNKTYRTQYERQTDLKTMKKGLGEGLKLYRYWIYQWLTPEQRKLKERYYYTPDEITAWQNSVN